MEHQPHRDDQQASSPDESNPLVEYVLSSGRSPTHSPTSFSEDSATAESAQGPSDGDLSTITTRDDLRDAIRTRDERLLAAVSGKQLTTLARALEWQDYDFQTPGDYHTPQATILERVNSKVLSVLAPDGVVYQLGDVIRFEAQKTSTWGGTRSTSTRTYEHQIDFLGERTASISRNPTYSNVPGDSPTAHFGRTDIELVERSNLDDYRHRLTEGTDITILDSINGWELVDVETYERDSDYTPTNLVTRMQWGNGENTYLTAQWRGSYNCWYLSTPAESVLTDANSDDYLYEIDVPQQVVRSETILALAREAMQSLDPTDFQDAYDLSEPPEDAEADSELTTFRPSVPIPAQIGDWVQTDRQQTRVVWTNANENSAWHNFCARLLPRGGFIIRNETADERHDHRYVKKHFANGEPHPDNVGGDYAWRNREMFDDNWFYGLAWLVETSRTPVASDTLDALTDALPGDHALSEVSHGLDTDPHRTMDRTDGTLLAYSGSSPRSSSP